MNTPTSDAEQIEYLRQWCRKRARKKMGKLERKLQRYAKEYFGEPMAIVYARDGAKIVTNDGEVGEIRI